MPRPSSSPVPVITNDTYEALCNRMHTIAREQIRDELYGSDRCEGNSLFNVKVAQALQFFNESGTPRIDECYAVDICRARVMMQYLQSEADRGRQARVDFKDAICDAKATMAYHGDAHGRLLDRVLILEEELRDTRRKVRKLQNLTADSVRMYDRLAQEDFLGNDNAGISDMYCKEKYESPHANNEPAEYSPARTPEGGD